MNDIHKPTKTLKELRLKTGLTQYAVSEILGVRGKTVGEWERGVTQPHMSASKFLVLCKTFDCSLEELAAAIEIAGTKDPNLDSSQKEEKQLVTA
jgi:transcriptional regulator with XRE-family HTH domain